MNEIWKSIPEVPHYEVSSAGQIRHHKNMKVRKLFTHKLGYKQLIVKANGAYVYLSIHRCVALAFLGDPPPGKYEINHINGNKADNRVENLEWTDRKGNLTHAWATGLITANHLHKRKGMKYKKRTRSINGNSIDKVGA